MSGEATRRAVLRALAAAATGVLILGGVALGLGFGEIAPGAETRIFALAGLAVASVGLWLLHDFLTVHFRALRKVETLATALAANESAGALPPRTEADEATQGLRDALLALAAQRRDLAAAPDARLTAVLAEVGEALLLLTPDAQISLVNGPAKTLLGAERIAVGTSAFDAFDRPALLHAMRRAAISDRPVEAGLVTRDGRTLNATLTDLREHRGVLICVRAGVAGPREVEHDLALHDMPPDAPLPDAATALDRLPVLVLDCETTGLDPAADRIVAIGAVRMFGARVYRGTIIDLLTNPGIAIPAASTAIHGISDAMVRDAPGFAAQAEALVRQIAGAVVVGHNVGFDLAVLKAEAARAGIAWPEVPSLCTAQLAAALDPGETALDLEPVASRHEVSVTGRHTALGDTLVTAELYGRMVARLQARGILTLGAAQTFAASAKRVRARQRAAGW